MSTHVQQIPETLGMPRVLEICHAIHALPAADEYVLDFSRTQHFEPFGMLLVGSAIRRLRERDSVTGRRAHVVIAGKNFAIQGHDYARRLGFWWSIGDDADLPSISRTATNTTIPITRLCYSDLFKQAGHRDPIRAEVVGDAAADLATTLSGGAERSDLWLSLEYCFREMFRNVFEHGRTDSVWYTGSTRPTRDDVQIAIVDSGRGIKDSLAEHPQHRYSSDVEAIRAALRPGVSRNAGKVRSAAMTEKLLEEFPGQNPALYDNSGYGLTLTSNLAREAGQFALVSGSTSVAFLGNHETVSETRHLGTAIRVVLHPSKLEGALDRARLKADRESGSTPRSGSLITASMAARLGLGKSGTREPRPQ